MKKSIKGILIGVVIWIIVLFIFLIMNECFSLFFCGKNAQPSPEGLIPTCGSPIGCIQGIFIYTVIYFLIPSVILGLIIIWILGKIKSKKQITRYKK